MNFSQNGSSKKTLNIPDHSSGHYENIPGRIGNSSKGIGPREVHSPITNATMSGGINRNVRAKSEKREIVDSWFSKSFANAGGLNYKTGIDDNENDKSDKREQCMKGNNGSHHQYQSESSGNNNGETNKASEDPEGFGSFMDRKRAFENLIAQTKQSGNNNGVVIPPNATTSIGSIKENVSCARAKMSVSPGEMFQSPPAAPKQQPQGNNGVSGTPGKKTIMPYRGCKTTSNVDEAGDWDFLSTLNDILRQENFIGDSYLEDNQNSFDTNKKPHASDRQSFNRATLIINGNGANPSPSSSSANLNYIPNPVPLSPRPPRPVRKADRRREYAKARSMDIAHLASSANISTAGPTDDFDSPMSNSQHMASSPSCASPIRNVTVETVMSPLPMNIFNPQPYTGLQQAQISQSNNSNGRCVSPYHNVPSTPPTSSTANDLSQGRKINHPLTTSCTSPLPIRHTAISSSPPFNGPSNDSSGITSSHLMTPNRRDPHFKVEDSEPRNNTNSNNNSSSNGPRPPLNSPPPLEPHRLPVSPLLQMNPISSSLDSIYDRLKVTSEYHDLPSMAIGRNNSPYSSRPVTQLYEGKGSANGLVYDGGRYPPPPNGPIPPHHFYYGYGNYYNSSSNPNFFGSGRLDFDPNGGWGKSGLLYSPEYDCMVDRYGFPIMRPRRLPRDDPNNKGRFSPNNSGACGSASNNGPGVNGSNSNTGSLPRLWNKMPEYRSRSFGSLKKERDRNLLPAGIRVFIR